MAKATFIKHTFVMMSLLSCLFLLGCNTTPVADNPYAQDHRERQAERSERWMGSDVPTIEEVINRDVIDPHNGMDRQDYTDYFYGQREHKLRHIDAEETLRLEKRSQMLIEPEEPVIADDKLVTLAVTEDVPLKDVLIELARRADVDAEIDPKIEGGIIFRAKNRPFSQVIERICELAGLRYNIEDNTLRVERDLPFIRGYRMNLLNTVRSASSSMNVTTNIINSTGGSSGGGGGTVASGSSSSLSSSSENNDVWADIETGLTNILGNFSNTLVQERIQGGRYEQTASTGSAAASAGSAVSQESAMLSLNRQSGVITVLATKRQHEAIKDYLDRIQISQSSQVLIEAKILEVTLDDQFRSGINWNFLNNGGFDFSVGGNFARPNLTTPVNSTDAFTFSVLPTELFGWDATSLTSAINLVEQFGVSRTLSSPRLHAMNNQYAVLTFAENYVYFAVTVEEEEEDTDSGSDTTITIESEAQTVPIGVILALQPSIDIERNEVVMNVRPTLSRITGTVSDPGVAINAARFGVDVSSDVPIVEVRELDSVLRLKSGEIMVIGGLMEERSSNIDAGLPGASRVPVVGSLFKNQQRTSETVETVIFIKATIVPGKGVSVEDQDFYRRFSGDMEGLYR